jgi:hypothetical protein
LVDVSGKRKGCETGCGYVGEDKGKEGCQGKDGEEWWIAKIVKIVVEDGMCVTWMSHVKIPTPWKRTNCERKAECSV